MSTSIDYGGASARGHPWKKLKMAIPYLGIGYVCDKLAESYVLSEASMLAYKLIGAVNGLFGVILQHPLPRPDWRCLLFGSGVAIMMRLIVWAKGLEAKKFRHGVEYGSARWGTRQDIEPFLDSEFKRNIILTQTEGLRMTRPDNPSDDRNKNVLVIGGSGAGKTRFVVKPNLMQMHSSYVITDPKGRVLSECGTMLERHGYVIKVFDIKDFAGSMKYNPFAYIKDEKDIAVLVDAIIANTKNPDKSGGEQFWEDAEKLLYTAYISFIWYECIEEEQNFSSLLDMINASEVREDNENFKNAIDLLFDELEASEPDHYAVRNYKRFKLAAGKTAKSILISCGVRLNAFDIKEVRNLTEYDEMELDRIGDRKTALFIVTSDSTPTFNFLAAIMYSQLFNILLDKADNEYGGRLPYHVRCLLDEFSNIGQIPQFEKKLSTFREREISATIILQSKAQLKLLYKDAAEIICDDCDTLLFLGGKGKDTLKDVSELLGKETIDMYNTSDSRGSQISSSTNYQKLGHDMLSPDELGRMPGSKCICHIRGVPAFYSDKFDITKHPRYKELADYDKKNKYNVKKHMSTHLRCRGSDLCEYYDVGEV